MIVKKKPDPGTRARTGDRKPESAAGRVSSDIDFRGGAKMRDEQSGRAATVACFTLADTEWSHEE